MFTGTSWSADPNTSTNCIDRITTGSSFKDVIASMHDAGILKSTDVELKPTLSYDYDFALYSHVADNKHAFYEAFLINNGLLFRAGVSVGMPLSYTPEQFFGEKGEIIEAFLKNILSINIDRSGG